MLPLLELRNSVRKAAEGLNSTGICKDLKNAKQAAEAHDKIQAQHFTRVEYSVGGALVAAIIILFLLAWARTRFQSMRSGIGTNFKGVYFWIILFALILVAIIVKNALRYLPPEKRYRKLLGRCAQEKFFRTCKKECAEFSRGSSSTFRHAIFVAVPIIFAFFAVIIFSLQARHSLRRSESRARSILRNNLNSNLGFGARASGNSNRTSFSVPRAHVAVLSVAVPPNTRRSNSNFKVTLVQPGDNDVEQGEIEHDPTCAICLADMDSKPIGEIKCGHRFHHACISDWLRKAPRPTCPLCKAIVGDEDSQETEPVV